MPRIVRMKIEDENGRIISILFPHFLYQLKALINRYQVISSHELVLRIEQELSALGGTTNRKRKNKTL